MIFLAAVACAAAAIGSEDLLKQGADAMWASRFDDAERIYRQLVKNSPDEARLRLNLGLALYSGKKYREALPEIERYLKAHPNPGPTHLIAGIVHLKIDDACGAVGPLEKALKWKTSADTQSPLADAYSACNRPAEAAKLYTHLAAAQPDRYTRAAARAHWQARQYSDAKPLYAALESAHKSDPRFLYEYGDVLVRLEGAEAGLPYLENAVRIDPASKPARGVLGRALVEANRAAEAIPHLEAAADADPTLLMPLSRAYKAAGRAQDAARVEAEYRKRVGNQN